MPEMMDWLGRWEEPMAPEEMVGMVPAENAHGYQWYPKAVPLAIPKEKADFSRGPQLDWWLDDDKKSRKRGAGAHGIKRVLRSINKHILT